MDNIKLSYSARKLIGEELGIFDSESPILKSNKAFYTRAHLWEPFNYIRDLIETFESEKKNFSNEEAYLKFISEREDNLYKYIDSIIDANDELKETLGGKDIKLNLALCSDAYDKKFIDATMLEIVVTDNFYSTLKYELLDGDKLPDDIYDFIYNITKCKYLAKRRRIDTSKLNKYTQAVLLRALNEISFVILNIASKIISTNQLISVGNGKVVFSMSPKVNVQTLIKISDAINNDEYAHNIGCNTSIYVLKELSEKSDMLAKVYQDGYKELVGGNQYDRISYMRFIEGKEARGNDLIFEVNNTSCKMSRAIDMMWKTL